MREVKPGGIVTAVVTPFREDESIDYDSWSRVIEFLVESGIDGLFVLGSGGEFYALDETERKQATTFAIKAAGGRLPVYANVGAVTTREAVTLAQFAEKEGADYLAVITPYYIRPSADELIRHYSEICESVATSVFAYNIPGRTGVELTPTILGRIAESYPNFIGLKDSSGKIEQVPDWLKLGLFVFMGSDHLILPALDLGCVGAVTVCSNIAPRLFVEILRAWRSGDRSRAGQLQGLAAELRLALKLSASRSYVKEAMAIAGMSVGSCRRPAGRMPEEDRSNISEIIRNLKNQNFL